MLNFTYSRQFAKYALMIVSTIVILFYAKQKSTNDVSWFVNNTKHDTTMVTMMNSNVHDSPIKKSENNVLLFINNTKDNATTINEMKSHVEDSPRTNYGSSFVNKTKTMATTANVMNNRIQVSPKPKSSTTNGSSFTNKAKSNATSASVLNNQVQDLPKPKSANDIPLFVNKTQQKKETTAIVRNHTVQKVAPNCRRKCVHRNRNKIIYSNIGQAGLDDREAIRTRLANIAGYLCATVYISSPHVMLSPKHNNKRFVSKQLQWDDISVFKWIDEDTSVFGTLYNDSTNELIERPKLEHFSTVTNGTSPTKNWLKIRTNVNWDGFDQQLNQIEQFIINHPERGFILELTGNYYGARNIVSNWKRQPSLDNTTKRNWTTTNAIIRTRKEKNCNYVNRLIPPLMEDIVQRIWTDLYNIPSTSPDGGIIFLHIRRTDAIHECNTTIAKIQSFLNCSLSNRHEFGKHFLLLFGSDSNDLNYRNNVQSYITNQFNNSITLVDIDKFVQQSLQKLIKNQNLQQQQQQQQTNHTTGFRSYFMNNYYIFKIETKLKQMSHFRLIQRRSMCSDCSRLRQIST